ncbi:MAG: DUF3160 domain-containing protein, partial [Candidatus Altiarchaeota archaeon]|nr:DUF3160 domain-containing protein [Candidatus Altiarchaeota archaeon]
MDSKIFIGVLVIGVVLFSGCVKTPDETTTTTIKTTTTTFKATTTIPESGVRPDYCLGDSDCVPAQCCHPTSCINKKFAPDCRGIGCTMVCQGPIDCGAGRCACINNKCVVENLKPTPPEVLIIPSVSAKEVENPKLKMTSFYSLEGLKINLNSPAYQLPLNLGDVINLQKINSRFKLKNEQKNLLKKNGFTVIPYGGDDIVEPYEDLKQREIPIFITSDSLLHLYHIQFNEILKGIEEREFFSKITGLSLAMLERSEQDFNSFTDPELKEAARRNVAYFSVALKLLQTPTEDYDEEEVKREIEEWNKQTPWDKKTFQPIRKLDFEVRDYVRDDVEKEITYIEDHEGFNPSPIFNSNPGCNCLRPQCYCEDYSQYIPRGHYTRSERLKRYFKSMMWYGRIAFLLKGGD